MGPDEPMRFHVGPGRAHEACETILEFTLFINTSLRTFLFTRSEPQTHTNPHKTTRPPAPPPKGMWKALGHGRMWICVDLGSDRVTRRYDMHLQNGFAYFVGPARAHMGPHVPLIFSCLKSIVLYLALSKPAVEA